MANHAFNVTTVRNTSTDYSISITPSTSSGSPLTITEGDTVTFTWISSVAGAPPSQLNFGNISTNTFTDGSLATLYSVGSSFTRTVKTGGTIPNADSCRVSTTGSGFSYWYLYRVSSIDTLPDNFSLGTDIVNANPLQTYYTDIVTITGINTPVTASANNGGLISKNNGSYASSQTISNGDKIRVKIISNSSYSSTKVTSVTVGSRVVTFNVTTMASPAAGQIIPIGITSGNISIRDLSDLFGKPRYDVNVPLSNYLKAPGGTRVPDISQNSAVSSSLPLSLRSFLGSATSFYVSTYPANKIISYDTTSQGGTFYLRWEVGVDWFLGFHPDVMNIAEYRYVVTETGSSTGVSASSAVAIGTWSNLNRDIQIGITVPSYVERRYQGQITIYARHPKAPTQVVSCTTNYWFEFYGS